MSGKTGSKERAHSHSIFCSPFEWERIRELAKSNKQSISGYLVTTALTDSPVTEPNAGTAPQLARTGDERYALRDTAIELLELLGGPAGGKDLDWPGLAQAVKFLLETRLDEIFRFGLNADLWKELCRHFDENSATQLYEATLARNSKWYREQLLK